MDDQEDEERAAEKAAKKAAAERALIHEHAFQFVLASFHNGTPRVKAWTALRLAATISMIANSPAIDAIKNDVAKQPDKALDAVTEAVRRDEELRQQDQIAVTTQEAAVIDRSLSATASTANDGVDDGRARQT